MNFGLLSMFPGPLVLIITYKILGESLSSWIILVYNLYYFFLFWRWRDQFFYNLVYDFLDFCWEDKSYFSPSAEISSFFYYLCIILFDSDDIWYFLLFFYTIFLSSVKFFSTIIVCGELFGAVNKFRYYL